MTNSLERALALLELLEETAGGLTNSDISRALKIPKSTASYILSRLEPRGYLRRDAVTREYHIGLKTVALAHGALRELGFRSIAEPVLYRLAYETGLSAGIGVLQQKHVLLVDRVEGQEFLRRAVSGGKPNGRSRAQRDIGRELPVHTTALGKVLLAFLPSEVRIEFLKSLELKRSTPKTIVQRARLIAELDVVRQRRYATADEEQYMGVRALGAPIFDAGGAVQAAVSLNGGVNELAWSELSKLIGLIEVAAADISKRAKLA